MNTPIPPRSPGTGTTPPALPTLGAMLGSIVASVLLANGKISSDPMLGGAIITSITGLFTAGFHWLGTKLGQNW